MTLNPGFVPWPDLPQWFLDKTPTQCAVTGCRRAVKTAEWCRKHYPKSERSRALRWGATYEEFARAEVYERDGWICGICATPVDRTLKAPNPMRVSLDHILPLSRGGGHTFDNAQCSHLRCNIRKGSSMPPRHFLPASASASERVERRV